MTTRNLMMSLLLLAGIGSKGQTMEEAFKNPPAEAKPLMIWQWMDGLGYWWCAELSGGRPHAGSR